MPSFNQIFEIVKNDPLGDLDTIRKNYIKELYNYTNRNIIIYYSGWLQKKHLEKFVNFGIDDSDKIGFMSAVKGIDKTKGLDLILHTPGGEMGATEHLVYYLKDIFSNNIRVIVPQIAMSAGTMIALASQKIIMGNYSNLGPIDPQLSWGSYGGIPAYGILEEYDKAKEEIKKNPSTIPIWQVLVSKYSPALIGECEKVISWSKEIVEEWLKDGMFKGKEDDEKIKIIIQELSNHAINRSHSRHISLNKTKELLGSHNIINLNKFKELQEKVLSVHHATIITLDKSNAYKIIENQEEKPFAQQAITPQSSNPATKHQNVIS